MCNAPACRQQKVKDDFTEWIVPSLVLSHIDSNGDRSDHALIAASGPTYDTDSHKYAE